MSEQEAYDFVIIGSGMGGLTSAVILAKKAYRVLVLEKNHQIGGAMQVFSRDKCVFDTGVHYIGGMDKGENLYKLFRYLGILDELNLKRLDDDCFDLIRLPNGTTFKHGQGYENFIRNCCESFPGEEEAIHAFCDHIRKVVHYFPLYNLKPDGEQTYYNSPEILQLGAWDFVCSITKNEDLRTVLLGSGPLYAGDKHSTPFYVVALIMNSYIKGSYRPVDGGSQIAIALAKQVRQYGGKILRRKEVISADFDIEKRITQLRCSDGSCYSGKNYISNMHPAETIRIIGRNHFRPAYRDRIEKLENTVSAFMLYITLEEGAFPYMNHNLYLHFSKGGWDTKNYNKDTWPEVLYVCTPAASRQPDYAESICAMAYMNYEELQQWTSSHNTVIHPSERGESYEAFKKEKEERIIQRLEEQFPGIRKHIKNVYSSTPLTYQDYLGSPGGSLYGIMKNYHHPEKTVVNARTKVPNLYLSGQNIIFHGILGATIGAFVTCFNFVDMKQVLSEINDHEI